MTSAPAHDVAAGRVRRLYQDVGSGYDVLVTTPDSDPQRWQEYLAGARRSYRAFGVEHALELDLIEDGKSTSLLFVVLSPDGETVGGMRAEGPCQEVATMHAYLEWNGHPAQAAVREKIESRLPDGLVETKTAWVAAESPKRRELATGIYRGPVHAASLLGARYALGTTAAHASPGWKVAGGVVDDTVPAVAYPDERYLTKLVWWDTWSLGPDMSVSQAQALAAEASQLRLPTQQARS